MTANPTLERLQDQIDWYDRKSLQSQKRFKWLKAVELITAASIPVVTSFPHAPMYVAAILGASVVVIEGLLHLNQYQQNWISYRATCEALKHEKFLYLARADTYADAADPPRMLAERIEGLVSQEHAKWIVTRQQTVEARTKGI